MGNTIQYMSKIYQITNLEFLPSIVNFPNWISDTFCVKAWRKLLPSPAWMPACRPVLPKTNRLKPEPRLMIALLYPQDRTEIRDISSPVPLQWSPHPSRSALKPSFIKLGIYTERRRLCEQNASTLWPPKVQTFNLFYI